tara:strand:- start:1096 stop:2001 length:906 start_codon:yes stop_codon:yes gene_type:complete
MAKVNRKTQKIFALNASNNGQFGSAQATTKILSNDLDTLQALTAFLDGWLSGTVSGDNLPTLEEMQALHYITTSQISYLFQEGIAEFDLGTEYHANSLVKKVGTYELYGSVINTNTGNALPTQVTDANWEYLGDLSSLAQGIPLTTKGDLLTYDTGNARLPVGTDGQVLVADSAEATGLKWGEGVDPEQLCKAWVKFNGVSEAISDSFNVSSISDVGVGMYDVNYTVAMASANYVVLPTCSVVSGQDGGTTDSSDRLYAGFMIISRTTVPTALKTRVVHANSFYTPIYEPNDVYVATFGSQ